MKNKILKESIDQPGKYCQRNCLLINGMEENSDDNTDKLALNTVNNDLEIM